MAITTPRSHRKAIAKTGTEHGPTTQRGEEDRANARALDRLLTRRAEKLPLSPMQVETHAGGGVSLSYKASDQDLAACRLLDALATGDAAFGLGILGQLANVASFGQEVVGDDLDFALSVVKAIGPQDELEALLATQMAAVHINVMAMARNLRQARDIELRDSASNTFNKLARTFATQVEALKKYRSTGEQSIRVQHVTVSAGQAVVGISQGGGGGGGPHESASQSHAPSKFDECDSALLCHEQALGVPLPRPSA